MKELNKDLRRIQEKDYIKEDYRCFKKKISLQNYKKNN